MAISIYHRPLGSTFQNWVQPYPFQEMVMAGEVMEKRATKNDEAADKIQENLLRLKSLPGDRVDAIQSVNSFNDRLSDIYDKYDGNLSARGLNSELRGLNRQINDSWNHGKEAAILANYNENEKLGKALELANTEYASSNGAKGLPQTVTQDWQAMLLDNYGNVGAMKPDGTYNNFDYRIPTGRPKFQELGNEWAKGMPAQTHTEGLHKEWQESTGLDWTYEKYKKVVKERSADDIEKAVKGSLENATGTKAWLDDMTELEMWRLSQRGIQGDEAEVRKKLIKENIDEAARNAANMYRTKEEQEQLLKVQERPDEYKGYSGSTGSSNGVPQSTQQDQATIGQSYAVNRGSIFAKDGVVPHTITGRELHEKSKEVVQEMEIATNQYATMDPTIAGGNHEVMLASGLWEQSELPSDPLFESLPGPISGFKSTQAFDDLMSNAISTGDKDKIQFLNNRRALAYEAGSNLESQMTIVEGLNQERRNLLNSVIGTKDLSRVINPNSNKIMREGDLMDLLDEIDELLYEGKMSPDVSDKIQNQGLDFEIDWDKDQAGTFANLAKMHFTMSGIIPEFIWSNEDQMKTFVEAAKGVDTKMEITEDNLVKFFSAKFPNAKENAPYLAELFGDYLEKKDEISMLSVVPGRAYVLAPTPSVPGGKGYTDAHINRIKEAVFAQITGGNFKSVMQQEYTPSQKDAIKAALTAAGGYEKLTARLRYDEGDKSYMIDVAVPGISEELLKKADDIKKIFGSEQYDIMKNEIKGGMQILEMPANNIDGLNITGFLTAAGYYNSGIAELENEVSNQISNGLYNTGDWFLDDDATAEPRDVVELEQIVSGDTRAGMNAKLFSGTVAEYDRTYMTKGALIEDLALITEFKQNQIDLQDATFLQQYNTQKAYIDQALAAGKSTRKIPQDKVLKYNNAKAANVQAVHHFLAHSGTFRNLGTDPSLQRVVSTAVYDVGHAYGARHMEDFLGMANHPEFLQRIDARARQILEASKKKDNAVGAGATANTPSPAQTSAQPASGIMPNYDPNAIPATPINTPVAAVPAAPTTPTTPITPAGPMAISVDGTTMTTKEFLDGLSSGQIDLANTNIKIDNPTASMAKIMEDPSRFVNWKKRKTPEDISKIPSMPIDSVPETKVPARLKKMESTADPVETNWEEMMELEKFGESLGPTVLGGETRGSFKYTPEFENPEDVAKYNKALDAMLDKYPALAHSGYNSFANRAYERGLISELPEDVVKYNKYLAEEKKRILADQPMSNEELDKILFEGASGSDAEGIKVVSEEETSPVGPLNMKEIMSNLGLPEPSQVQTPTEIKEAKEVEVSPGKSVHDKAAETAAQVNIEVNTPELGTSSVGEDIKSIADSQGPSDTTNTKLLNSAAQMADSTYELGSKGGNAIDCSGFVHKVLTDAGYDIPTDDLSSQGIWVNSKDKKQYTSWDKVTATDLKPGTVISIDTGDHGFDKGRKYGIDHIMTVVHDQYGRPMIAESASGKNGVALTPFKDRVAELKDVTKKIYIGNYGNSDEEEANMTDFDFAPATPSVEYNMQGQVGGESSGGGSLLELGADMVLDVMKGLDIQHADLENVMQSVKDGATMEDLQAIKDSYIADKIGSASPHIEETPVMNVAPEGLLEGKRISNTPTVDLPEYQSKNFVLDLKQIKSFDTLPNVTNRYQAGGKNINQFYKDFKPIQGDIVMSVQQNLGNDRKARATLVKPEEFKQRAGGFKQPYYLSMEGGELKVINKEQAPKAENLFLNQKGFDMDELIIDENENISVVWDSNIGAWIPKTKAKSEGRKERWGRERDRFVIGLNDNRSNKTGKVNVENATQYGRSRGGSFIVFSKDLQQQYMVGGSFKDLYRFHQELKAKNPNKEYSIFTSDTGTYSNSVFPKGGKIDGKVYRKSSFRNTYGNMAHIVLKR
jgi:cell wall-associated NlpC family hydrolase